MLRLKHYSLTLTLPVKKLAILTKVLSSVLLELPEAKDVFEPPEGLRGTCNVLERRRCFSSRNVYEQLFGTLTTHLL